MQGGSAPSDGIFEPPISDNSVSTTCTGGIDTEWLPSSSYPVPVMDSEADEIIYHGAEEFVEFGGRDQFGGVDVAIRAGGLEGNRGLRSKNVLKNNFKAIKSGLKSAANWIPGIFNRSAHRSSLDPNPLSKKSKSKSKLTRNDSVNSSLHSNSFFSSGIGSENSQFTSSNSYSTSSNSKQVQQQQQQQQYGQFPSENAGKSLTRCTSFDPISIDGSSRRSSEASLISLAAVTVASRCTHRSQTGQEPKHLKQTENLVIQPQSMALNSEHYPRSRLPAHMPPNQNVQNCGMINQMVAQDNCHQMSPLKMETNTEVAVDPINNLILPDDMVSFLENITFRCISLHNTMPYFRCSI